ncbi:mediator of RNA polymerase II transcription subunit 13 [Lates japonicus]|uniref:Mediator of RNA polymerase II transcription subunit 13 n=1 Tax=Lates japonicus TaxID=270547 RepID=A0AAD3RK59_LATJO|nr:mediator of RNA polymerase II transcription subunit 13 [Lates japonicus]
MRPDLVVSISDLDNLFQLSDEDDLAATVNGTDEKFGNKTSHPFGPCSADLHQMFPHLPHTEQHIIGCLTHEHVQQELWQHGAPSGMTTLDGTSSLKFTSRSQWRLLQPLTILRSSNIPSVGSNMDQTTARLTPLNFRLHVKQCSTSNSGVILPSPATPFLRPTTPTHPPRGLPAIRGRSESRTPTCTHSVHLPPIGR